MAGAVSGQGAAVTTTRPGRRTRGAVLTGIGLAITLDEVVFHQLLRWHHLLDRRDLALGLISDGVLHLLGTAVFVVGAVLLARTYDGRRRRAVGAVLAGAGGFNVFDGVVDHKLLGLHQVREGVPDLLPYDLAWIGSAAVVLLVGLVLRRPAARHR